MISGGKDWRIHAAIMDAYGHGVNGVQLKEMGILKEATFNTGRQREQVDGIGDNYPISWGEGAAYHPSLKLTYVPSGNMIKEFLAALTAVRLNTWDFKKEPTPLHVEAYTKSPSFKAIMLYSGLAKSTSINVQGVNSPVQVQTELHGEIIQKTNIYASGYKSKFIGFHGSSQSPDTIAGRSSVDKAPLEGHHIKAYIKLSGSSETRMYNKGYLASYGITFTHDLEEGLATLIGDDGQEYTLPAEYAVIKSSIQAAFSVNAKDIWWWEQAEANKKVDWVRLHITPPASSGEGAFNIYLRDGIIQTPDIPIKAVAALGMSINILFKEVDMQ